MLIALVATVAFLPPTPKPERRSSLREPITALRYRSLRTTSLTGLLYNWGFFTLLGYAPFLMDLGALELGWVFFAWGVLVAIFAVFGAPWLDGRFGTARTLTVSLVLVAVILAVIGTFPDARWVVIVAVIASGAFVGLNNTLVTTAVMSISPVPRPVASATYGFVRFIGGGLAPFAAGLLAEHLSVHVPFLLGAVVVLAGVLLLQTVRAELNGATETAEEAEEAAGEVPALQEEAVVAQEAIARERR
jgi:predicted MFS family arabinose efflux permease